MKAMEKTFKLTFHSLYVHILRPNCLKRAYSGGGEGGQ